MSRAQAGVSRRCRGPAMALAVVMAWAACAPGAGPAPQGLAYGVPEPNPSFYLFADTAVFTVHADPLGPMTVSAAQDGRAALTFAPGTDGFRVEVRFPRFRSTYERPSEEPERVDESAIGGAFTVVLDERGRVEVVDTPALSPALLDVTGPRTLVRPLFVSLPGAAVAAGGKWVDTIVSVEESPALRSRTRAILTTTLVGDTVVAGRRLLVLATRADNELEVTSTSDGVTVEQRLTGSTVGRVLWDPRSYLLIERFEEGHLTGTLDMPGRAAAALPMTARVRRWVSAEEPPQ